MSETVRLSPEEWEQRLKQRVIRAQQAYIASKGNDDAIAKELQLAINLFSNLVCRFQVPSEPYFEPVFEPPAINPEQRALEALATASQLLARAIFPEQPAPTPGLKQSRLA